MTAAPVFRWQAVGRRKTSVARVYLTPGTGKWDINGRTLATIKVMDTGVGIPEEHQAKIFERFYRVDPSHTIPGTGLGLSLVHYIVTELHNGQIGVDSAVGKGTTVTFV